MRVEENCKKAKGKEDKIVRKKDKQVKMKTSKIRENIIISNREEYLGLEVLIQCQQSVSTRPLEPAHIRKK